MATDRSGDGLGAPATHWYRIIPNDGVDLDPIPRSLYVDATGTLAVVDVDGNVMPMAAAAVGYHPLRARRVKATGTTATVYALY